MILIFKSILTSLHSKIVLLIWSLFTVPYLNRLLYVRNNVGLLMRYLYLLHSIVKGIYFVIYGIISDFNDKGQFQYLTNLKGPQEGTYLYTTQFLSLR